VTEPRDPLTEAQPPGRPDGGSGADRLWWYRDVRQPAPAPRRRLRRPGRPTLLDALACLSLSALCFSQARSETLFRADWDFYRRVPLGAPVLLAFALNLVALAAVGLLAVQGIRRLRGPVWSRAGAVAAASALLVALNYVRLASETVGRWTGAVGAPALLAAAAVVLAAALVWPRPALRGVHGLALVASPLAVGALVQAFWMFLELAAGPMWARTDPAPLDQAAPSLRRVVWLVFSELDQRLAFDERPAGLDLPELDRLRREAVYAGAAHPPAGATEISMPALITGRPVVAVAATSPNDLVLTFAHGKAARWSVSPNVFSRVRVLGYDAAAIGWHLPYPRVLGASLGAADWRSSIAHEQTRGETFVETLLNQWGSLVPPLHARRLLVQRFTQLGERALRTATDGRFALVLVHLPVPRPPGIYDPGTERLTAWHFGGDLDGYLDNLVLADRMLGELRRALQRARQDDRTWLVVTSDHWWRGARRDDGQEDHRVPFLVRPPDGDRAVHVDAPFNTLLAHDLVISILRGSITGATDVGTWLAGRAMAPPRGYTPEGRPVY